MTDLQRALRNTFAALIALTIAQLSYPQQPSEAIRSNSQRYGYIDAVAKGRVTGQSEITMVIDLSVDRNAENAAGIAFAAKGAGGIADFWKFNPQLEASAWDNCGNRFYLQEATGLHWGREQSDWTILPQGSSTAVVLKFHASRNVCLPIGFSFGTLLVLTRGGRQGILERANWRFEDVVSCNKRLWEMRRMEC